MQPKYINAEFKEFKKRLKIVAELQLTTLKSVQKFRRITTMPN